MIDVMPNTKGTVVTIAADNGKAYKKMTFSNGAVIKIPINKDGTVKWFDDTKLVNEKF